MNARAALLLVAAAAATAQAPDRPLYRDPSQPVERRIDDLLARMTLKEKLGQLNMPCVYVNEMGRDVAAKQSACRRFAEGTYTAEIGPGGGFFTLANTVLHEGTRQQAEFFNELQKIAIEKTRLGIPLLQTEEGTHGAMASGKTIFPEGPALGSTWNMDLIHRIYATAAAEARSVGIHQLYTLVVEPNRDPRLGRNQEGYSEDPFLCSRIAESIVTGAQGKDLSAPDKVVAGLCHYPGQSQPVSGLERGAMEVSERMLREVFLPPWVAGIRKAGARGVMATYPAIDGTPTHASSKILTGILRGELNFQGLVLGEGSGISTIVYERLAATQKEAGQLALRAGLDVGISYEPGYMGPMAESLAEGKASMADIDRSVRRVLRQKFDLGLFEHPYVDADKALRVNHTTEAQDLALDAARQSIVLLKNEGILPLKKDLRRIAVIGPNADDQANQLGDYVPKKILHEVVTIREGIRRKLPNATVVYAKGCDVLGNDRSGFDEALRAAKGADAAIVVVGENGQGSKQATNGEGYDVASLDLTGPQDDLVRAIHQTGTPTVVVLVNGRPLSTRWISERIPALVEAWLPGERGGLAVADVLFGDYNPSGRLPITVPRHSGQLPVFYNYKPSKAYWVERGWGRRYADMPAAPLYPFGHGLSYTKFDYSNLRISPQSIDPTGQVSVSLDVRNSGGRPGEEVVQLYLNDLVSSVTRPVKELRAFEKIALNPGQTRTVTFTLKSEDLALLDQAMHWVVEPGEFEVMVGRSSADILLRGKFEVAPLPGKGMAQHPFLYCGEWQKRSIDNQEMHIVRDGKIVWTYTNQRRGELGDCHLLANGNILFSRQFGASEITPDKKIVWEYDGPPGVEIHTTFPIDADRVLLMQNGNPAKALIIHKPTGKIEREIVLPVRDPKGTHGQFRHIRMTKAGTLLVAHMDLAKVVEYNLEGRELWSVPAPSAWAAVRLDNGNTLISGNQNGYVREVNPKGETVWEITKNELPGFPLYTVQEVSRLSNGNTLINNWAGSLPLVEWPNVSQLIEVTPDKRVAWALRDYTVLGPASSTQLLDDPNSVR